MISTIVFKVSYSAIQKKCQSIDDHTGLCLAFMSALTRNLMHFLVFYWCYDGLLADVDIYKGKKTLFIGTKAQSSYTSIDCKVLVNND